MSSFLPETPYTKCRMNKTVAHKYLSLYAEKSTIPKTLKQWDEVVCIPCHREWKYMPGCLRFLERAANTKSVLVIVVVNSSTEADFETIRDNQQLLTYLDSYQGNLTVHPIERLDFPPKQGVGLARKIAADLALTIWEQGLVKSPYFSCTDADARVSRNYFSYQEPGAAAVVHPFQHRGIGKLGLTHRFYEHYLRHYEAGLRRAGSPYAFQTIGSLMTISFEAYAKVRGFPKRMAAEDFYMLNKLAKIGPVITGGGKVTLIARPSNRVPFGTGAACAKIFNEEPHRFDPLPDVAFDSLETVLTKATKTLSSEDWSPPDLEPEIYKCIEQAWQSRKDARSRIQHFHCNFDALSTFRFLRTFEQTQLPL